MHDPSSGRPEGPLSQDELERYMRQLLLPEIGVEGQLRLRAGSVAVVGAGGLGSPLALYLAAAGVGRIGLIESDRVDASNLHRQILYEAGQVGDAKIEAAHARLSALNPLIRVVKHPVRLTAENARETLREYDVVADGSDNFATRYLVNDTCIRLEKPNVQGSVLRFEGHLSVFDARRGPCYRCLFPEPPAPGDSPSCAEAGVLGALPGVIGALQATEVLKLLLGIGEPLIGRYLIFDGLGGRFRELRFEKDPACAGCGTGADHPPLPRAAAECSIPPPPIDATQLEISPEELRERLEGGDPPILLDVREPVEAQLCAIAGSRLIPFRELPRHLRDLPMGRPIVTYCHVGLRSLAAARYLRQHQRSAWSLRGGIDAWASRIDPRMPRY